MAATIFDKLLNSLQSYRIQFRNLLYDFKKPIDSNQKNSQIENKNVSTHFHSKKVSHFNQDLTNESRAERRPDIKSLRKLPILNVNSSILIVFIISTLLTQFANSSIDTGSIHCPLGYRPQRVISESLRLNESSKVVNEVEECVDIDECLANEEERFCEQHCHNTEGSYICHCYPGFTLTQDGYHCETLERLKMLVSSGGKMYLLIFKLNAMDGPDTVEILFEAKSQIVSFTVDAANNEIYYMEKEDGLWIFNADSGKHYRSKVDKYSQNTTIPNAKLNYNWVDSSLLIAIDVRILKLDENAWDHNYYISNINQHISDFSIDPIQNLLYVSELGAQSKLTVRELDSKRQLHDLKTPTNNYLQQKMKVSTNMYDSKIYLVNTGGNLYSCSIDPIDNLTCTVEIANGNISSQIIQFGSSLLYLTKHKELVVCHQHNCSQDFQKFPLPFEPLDIAIWSKHSQITPDTIDCSFCDHGCDIVDTWFSQCRCDEGYSLDSNNRTCVDINECQTSANSCQETCINLQGSFECSCESPNTMLAEDGQTCEIFMTSCEDNLCSHGCETHNDSDSRLTRCTCPVGSYLMEDKRTCTGCRVDYGGCSHICKETGVHMFECGCPQGFVLLPDQKSCALDESNVRILGSTDEDLKVLTIPDLHVDRIMDIEGVKQMSIDQEHNCVYFISSTSSQIGKLDLSDFSVSYLSLDMKHQNYSFTSVAIDWFYDRLYLSDSSSGSIYRMSVSNEADQPKKLFPVLTNLVNPRDLSIDSDTGDLYFICESSPDDAKDFKTKLMQLNLSNNVLLTLLYTLNETTALTIDYLSQQLYFSDLQSGKINSINIDPETRNNTIEVSTLNNNAFKDNLQIADTLIYTIDMDKRWKIVTYSKESGKKLENLSKNKGKQIGDLNSMIIFHKSEPLNDRRVNYGACSKDNGGCQHKCESFLNRAICSCYENFTLSQDGFSCNPRSEEPDNSQDYQISEDVSRETCSQKGLFCHRHADCVKRGSQLLVCVCKDGFYGDGIASCRDEALQCTPDDVIKADCGKHGECHKERTFGNIFQLSCICENHWVGQKCWEFGGKRRLTAEHQEPPQISSIQIVELGLLLALTMLLLVFLASLLAYRRKRQQEKAQSTLTRVVCGEHYHSELESLRQAPESPVAYKEVSVHPSSYKLITRTASIQPLRSSSRDECETFIKNPASRPFRPRTSISELLPVRRLPEPSADRKLDDNCTTRNPTITKINSRTSFYMQTVHNPKGRNTSTRTVLCNPEFHHDLLIS